MSHLAHFDGLLVPDVFVNQDADPFLFELVISLKSLKPTLMLR